MLKAIGPFILPRALALWALGLVVAVSVAVLADDAMPSKEAKERQVKDQLRRLEQAVKRAAVSAPHLDREKLLGISKAADEFARKVAGEDEAKYLRVFEEAVRAGLRPANSGSPRRKTDPVRQDGFNLSTAPDLIWDGDNHGMLLPHSIRESKRYQENSKRLRVDSNKPGSLLIPPAAKIVGGVLDVDDLFPDCVAVGDKDGYCCTGTLIAENLVVTAGHCFPCVSQDGRIFIGRDISQTGKIVEVLKAVRHPDYGKSGVHNDLTLLILKDKVQGVMPRPIAMSAAVDAAPYIRAVGYGTTDFNGTVGFGRQRLVDIPVATADCSTGNEHFGCDPGRELVAGQKMLDKDTCKGDSGGPIYVLVNSKWIVCGATSRSAEDAPRVCGDAGIYARLDKHKDEMWFQAVVREAGAALPKP